MPPLLRSPSVAPLAAPLLLVLASAALGSPFDPHPLPPASPSPFFDGWFVRLVDHDRGLSVATIFGGFKAPGSASYNQTWMALLYRPPGTSAMITEQRFVDEVRITPRSEATAGAISSFVWESTTVGSFEVDDDIGAVDFSFQALRVRARLSRRVPWDAGRPDAAGPEGWAGEVLPVPCHYFVHSFASRVSYELLPAGGSALSGTGYAHMETNYGRVFPEGWVWVEAIHSSGEAQLMLTGGRFVVGPLASEAFVLGYRSPQLHWDFRTTDLDRVKRQFDASVGFLRVVAREPATGRELQVNVTAPPGSFSEPLFVPTEAGFSDVPGSVESYSSAASVAAYLHGRLVEERLFTMAALEFGGTYRHVAVSEPAGERGDDGFRLLV